MTAHFWLGMGIVFVSGALNGSFALPMKYAKAWRWENTWLALTTAALLIAPLVLAVGFIPNLTEVYRGLPFRTLLIPLIFGFLWGIAQVTFGISIAVVGMALAFAVVSGMSCVSGSLVPMAVLHPHEILSSQGILILVSIPILLTGLLLYGMAGRRREREQALPKQASAAVAMSFVAGLAICIFTGILGPAWNIGFALSGDIKQRAETLGAGPQTSNYALWLLVLGAGFIPSLVYCSYLLFRHGTWSLFRAKGSSREALLGVAAGLLWLSGVVGYGVGATLIGTYGVSAGFVVFTAAQILTANMLGVVTGEWKTTSSRTRWLLKGAVAVILISVVVVNLGGLF